MLNYIDAYDGLKQKILDKKEEIEEFLNISKDVFFYDDLQTIIKYNISGDEITKALYEIFGKNYSPICISIDGVWDDYTGFFNPISIMSIAECHKIIEKHYRQ